MSDDVIRIKTRVKYQGAWMPWRELANDQSIANALRGKAPSGFGLGNSEPRYATTDTAGPYSADTITENCFFVAKTNTPTGDWCYGICISRTQNNKIQIMWNEQGSGPWACDGGYAERIMKAGIWGAWEWVNPPMLTGVEYRTTERYKGKPVYTQLMNFGNSPAKGTVKTVGMPPNSENQRLVWAQLTYYGITFPYYNNDNSIAMYIYVGQGSEKIYIHSPGDDRSDHGVIEALLKYTKNTD